MKWIVLRGRGGALSLGAALACLLTVGVVALAGQGDRAAAQAALAELSRESEYHGVVADSVDRAQDALGRGARMRAAGDEAHAGEADALARQWAETGLELLRAAKAETRANELRKKALETQAEVAKTREIVEDVIARTGRLRAQIEAGRQDGGAPRSAVEVHDGERAPATRLGGGPASLVTQTDAGAP